jgi:peptidoglycan/LPS O-acetylase OafA/YrhL
LYPLYLLALLIGSMKLLAHALHLPMLGLVDAFLRHREPKWHLWIGSGPSFVVVLLLVCWLTDKYYDDPVRRWLKTHGTGDRLVVLGGG